MSATRRAAAALAAALLVFLTATAAGAGTPAPFVAFLAPESVFVDVDAAMDLAFRAGDPAEHFNGYTVSIRFDPAVLALESVTRGTLLTGACALNFSSLGGDDSTVTYTHSLLCAQTFVDGPGELSVYRFRAVGTGISPLTIVSDPQCTFFDDGLCVGPLHPTFPREVTMTGAVVVAGDVPLAAPDAGPDGDAGSARSRLDFAPNPTRGGGTIGFALPGAGTWTVRIVDVAGRRVLERAGRLETAGRQALTWSGEAADGRALPAGVYFVTLDARTDGARNVRATRRIVRIP